MQGLGFRPTAKRIADELGITGEIRNSGGSVCVVANGDKRTIDEFKKRLLGIANISECLVDEQENMTFDSFEIIPSDNVGDVVGISADIATCKECEKELFDKKGRRYMHPFISCTSCGPRYTIMNSLPYDRVNTTMKKFPLCDECKEEYDRIDMRRCYAQTICCNGCGPRLNMSIDDAVDILSNGGVLAIKDIGGFHLACRADVEKAVEKIRHIKGRESKPFAVMFSSIEEIETYCFVNEKEKTLLLSEARPIVLLKKKNKLKWVVDGTSEYTGAFLPCNPVQLLILSRVSPLIMTSANLSGEVMITENDEILKLNVDVLSNDRDILTPLDDSILQVICENKVQYIRRARGYVPLGIKIDVDTDKHILAMGGDLKASFCFVKNGMAYMSGNFGDLEYASSFDAYKREIDRFSSLFDIEKDNVVEDCHPSYFSSNVFHGKNVLHVQHHMAHAASVIAEHSIKGDVLSFVFDGTGYGLDGDIWGAEVFKFDGKKFKRVEHMTRIRIPRSDKIAKDAELALHCYTGDNETLNKMLSENINTVGYTGMGRLIDAVAALLSVCKYNTYESECATKLEYVASRAKSAYKLTPTFNPDKIINEIKEALKRGIRTDDIALGFHLMIVELIVNTAKKYNIKNVTLSGGVFVNRIITENAIKALEKEGFSVYINEKVPTLDGGIALGQAYMALNSIEVE